MTVKPLLKKSLSVFLTTAVFLTYSMVTLASTPAVAGELTVSGIAGTESFVSINGEAVKSSRSVFFPAVITTPENASATISFGKAGAIRVEPGTTASVNFDGRNVTANLSNGSVKVLSSETGVAVAMPDGSAKTVPAGETATAGRAQDDDDDDNGGAAWWLWALVFGGAAAGMIIGATYNSNEVRLGGNGTVVSPVR
ncbi:MAG TPA: hypothetical protein DEP46_05905 [Blastocatellia bacterium]|nr:hypothetical protein [Blastocatellia bacterium]